MLDSKPPDRDYDPVLAGVLDAGTAWRAILHHALGLEDREPDLAGLLRWSATTAAIRYREAPGESAARWRPAAGEAEIRDGEVLLEGERVRGPGDVHRLIAAWADDARYGAARNGYHGGASPQEMVAPLMLLSDLTSRAPALEPCESRRPAWWDAPGRCRPGPSSRADSALPSHSSARPPEIPVGFLFHPEPPVDFSLPGWFATNLGGKRHHL